MIKIGEWVNSYSKGIFRIENILERYYEEFDLITDPNKKLGDRYDDRIVITKRLLNSKFKKSISYESCSEFFIVPLDKEQKERLQETLKQNPNWLTELNDYTIPDIISIYNWTVQLDSPAEKSKVNEMLKLVEAGLTLRQIHDEIHKRGLTKNFDRNFGNYLLQMTNTNHETVNKRYIWRNPKLIKT